MLFRSWDGRSSCVLWFKTCTRKHCLVRCRKLAWEAILPTLGWGKQSVWLAASGSRRSFRAEARTHFIDREQKTAVPCRTRSEIPPCCPCAALCEAIGRRTTPCTDKPVRSRCTALVGERREQKIGAQRTPYFPFLKRILIPRKIFFCPWFRLFRWDQGRSILVLG